MAGYCSIPDLPRQIPEHFIRMTDIELRFVGHDALLRAASVIAP